MVDNNQVARNLVLPSQVYCKTYKNLRTWQNSHNFFTEAWALNSTVFTRELYCSSAFGGVCVHNMSLVWHFRSNLILTSTRKHELCRLEHLHRAFTLSCLFHTTHGCEVPTTTCADVEAHILRNVSMYWLWSCEESTSVVLSVETANSRQWKHNYLHSWCNHLFTLP